ncbi:hypothetical protein [Tychonema sp. BBK16]|uniref:hypothetical protein n=1 Tax=Tychonema sp. BBK16 TaxID=2699888 RepID=UPI001F327C20|nr:hypothetical protein [Tychonema sp. BBK16]MCF6375668.1 hypothetical protein [Tychonema sp. BBK16]
MKKIAIKNNRFKEKMLEIERITVAEVPCVLEDNSRTLDSLKKCAQSSNNRNERREAVKILVNQWRDDIGFLELLGERAWIDKDANFREFCQQKLTELAASKAKSKTTDSQSDDEAYLWWSNYAQILTQTKRSI